MRSIKIRLFLLGVIFLLLILPLTFANQTNEEDCSLSALEIKTCSFEGVDYDVKRKVQCEFEIIYGDITEQYDIRQLMQVTLQNGVIIKNPDSCSSSVINLIFEEEVNETNEEITLDKLLNSKGEINTYLQENEVLIPGGADFLVKDGNILINISMNEGFQELFYIIVEEKRVIGIEEGVSEEISYEIKIDEETITEITQSENIGEKIVESYENKRIIIKAHGFGNKIKLFFGKIFLRLFA
ncbi:MAG TPA: hypothetical protein VMV95_01860 [Bacillota bacterium]|nr:hypothetical protein [Bacillota bacterium]